MVFLLEIVGKAQAGGKNAVFSVLLAADDGAVPHAFFTQKRPQNGVSVVDQFPVEAISADTEIDLFSIGSAAFPEMYKEICLHSCHLPF